MLHLCATILAAVPLAGAIPVTSGSAKAARLFEDGRTAVLDLDTARGAKTLREAVAAEPEFPLALAWLGRAVPGTDGLVFVQLAKNFSAKLPDLERMEIEALYAEKKGDEDHARKLKRELADAAPGDWVAQVLAGTQAQSDRKSQAALLYLQRAAAADGGRDHRLDAARGRLGRSRPPRHRRAGEDRQGPRRRIRICLGGGRARRDALRARQARPGSRADRRGPPAQREDGRRRR